MDQATRRSIRARRVANFHERLSQRRQISPEIALDRPAEQVEQRESLRRRVAEYRRRQERQREVYDRIIRETRPNREASEHLRRIREEHDQRLERRISRAEEMVRDAYSERSEYFLLVFLNLICIPLIEVLGIPPDIVAEYQTQPNGENQRQAPYIHDSDTDDSIPSVQDLADVSDPIDVPDLSDITSSSSDSANSSDLEEIPGTSEANESQPAVRDVVVRIERFRLILKS